MTLDATLSTTDVPVIEPTREAPAAAQLRPPIGQSAPRARARRLLQGRGRFTDDLHPPRLVHVAFVRSPYAFARMVSIDAQLARDRACWQGEPAVAIVAKTRVEAEAAVVSVAATFRFARNSGVTLQPRSIIADYDPATPTLRVTQ